MEDQSTRFEQHGFDTPEFSLNGLKTYARVVNILDGDTITCVIPVMDEFYKFSTRLSGIDTCEITSKDVALKEKAIAAQRLVIEAITGQRLTNIPDKSTIKKMLNKTCIVWLECMQFDKYGRLLADVYTDKSKPSLSTRLIECKLAYAYNGGKKQD